MFRLSPPALRSLALLALLVEGCSCGTEPEDSEARGTGPELIDARGLPSVHISVPTGWWSHEASEASLMVAGGSHGDIQQLSWSSTTGSGGPVEGTDPWNATVELQEGEQLLRFNAEDATGASASAGLYVLYQPDIRFDGVPTLSTDVALLGQTSEVDAELGFTTADEVQSAAFELRCGSGTTTTEAALDERQAGAILARASLPVPSIHTDCYARLRVGLAAGSRVSLPELLRVREPVTEERLGELTDLLDAASEVWEEGGQQAALDLLSEREDLALVGPMDETSIWLISDEGIPLGISAWLEQDTSGDTGFAWPAPRHAGVSAPPAPPPPPVPYADQPGRKVQLYSPSRCSFQAPGDVNASLARVDWAGFGEDGMVLSLDLQDAEVTPAALANSEGVGIYSLVTHGETFLPSACWELDLTSGEPIPPGAFLCPLGWLLSDSSSPVVLFINHDGPTADADLMRDLLAWRAALMRNLAGSRDACAGDWAVALLPGWFLSHLASDALQDGLVLASACDSARNASMAQAFRSRGAEAYLGFDDTIWTHEARDLEARFFEYWLRQCQDGDEALASAMTEVPFTMSPATPILVDGEGLPPVPSNLLLNPSFEDGSDHWVLEQATTIEGSYQNLPPHEDNGSLYANLKIVEATNTYWSGVYQVVRGTHPGTYHLSFWYKTVITDYHNYYSACQMSMTWPWFAVGIQKASGTIVPYVVYPTDASMGDDYCDEMSEYVPGTWTSDWKEVDLEVELQDGDDTAEVYFLVSGEWDYDHSVFVDAVSFGCCGAE